MITASSRSVAAEAVAEHLRERYPGGVVRYEMENLSALIFVCRRLPGDTVTTSLYLDAHAKSLSSALLELEIEIDPSLAPRARSAKTREEPAP